jgi:predicted CopG family antitoxin
MSLEKILEGKQSISDALSEEIYKEKESKMETWFVLANLLSVEEIEKFIAEDFFSLISFKPFTDQGVYYQFSPIKVSFDNKNLILYKKIGNGTVQIAGKEIFGNSKCEDSGITFGTSSDPDRNLANGINIQSSYTLREFINMFSGETSGNWITFLCTGREIPTFTDDMKKELISAVSKFYQ